MDAVPCFVAPGPVETARPTALRTAPAAKGSSFAAVTQDPSSSWFLRLASALMVGGAVRRAAFGKGVGQGQVSNNLGGGQRVVSSVQLRAAKKSTGEPLMHGDTVYVKVMTGRYIGELDGTTKLEWVKARGTKKDKEHALTIEKMNNRDEPIKNGDVVMFVMPQGVHMDVLGSAVRARYYDPRGEWQKITIVKQDGGEVYSGDQIFLRGHQGEYLDANPLERAPDGEVKARWRDEGEWQVMWIEK